MARCIGGSAPKEIDTGIATHKEKNCSNVACYEAEIGFRKDDIADCFGWVPGQGWPSSVPAPLDADWCNPDLAASKCRWLGNVDSYFLNVPTDNSSCSCKPISQVNCACCRTSPFDVAYPSEIDGLSQAFLTAIDSCGVGYAVNMLCEDATCEVAECGFLGGLFPIASGATHTLSVDPEDSTIAVASPWGSESFALQGGGSISTSSGQFLSGHVWADDGALGSHVLSGWHWQVLEAFPINIDAGALTIETSALPVVNGKGYDGSQGWSLDAQLDGRDP